MSERKNLVGKEACSEDWDDTAILNSFETGIMSFRTKAQSKPAVATTNSSASPGADKPLSAAPVPQSQKRTTGANPEPELKRPRAAANDTPTAAPQVESGEQNKAIPQLPQLSGGGVNDEALQSMLMAWYYSGYATGRYQALKEVDEAAAAASAIDAASEGQGPSDSPEDGDKTRGGAVRGD